MRFLLSPQSCALGFGTNDNALIKGVWVKMGAWRPFSPTP